MKRVGSLTDGSVLVAFDAADVAAYERAHECLSGAAALGRLLGMLRGTDGLAPAAAGKVKAPAGKVKVAAGKVKAPATAGKTAAPVAAGPGKIAAGKVAAAAAAGQEAGPGREVVAELLQDDPQSIRAMYERYLEAARVRDSPRRFKLFGQCIAMHGDAERVGRGLYRRRRTCGKPVSAAVGAKGRTCGKPVSAAVGAKGRTCGKPVSAAVGAKGLTSEITDKADAPSRLDLLKAADARVRAKHGDV
jgi:hypothetical protein